MYYLNDTSIFRPAFSAAGAALAILEPTLPLIGVCSLMILADSASAWMLSRRVRKAHPDRTGSGTGKFSSARFGRTLATLGRAWTLILLAFLVGRYVTDSLPVDLAKVAAGAICFWQMWSILENEASCNGAPWARLLQKILIDKTERHFDIDLSELSSPK